MAQDDDKHEHTEEEHDRMGMRARRILGATVEGLRKAKICEAVVLGELVRALVTGAVDIDISLSELVADVIDDYGAVVHDKAHEFISKVVAAGSSPKKPKGPPDVH